MEAKPVRVLPVDDEPGFLELVPFFLRREGNFEIESVSDVEFTSEYQEMGVKGTVWINLDESRSNGVSRIDFGTAKVAVDLNGTTIFADPMLEKVFRNLVDNSLRHGRK